MLEYQMPTASASLAKVFGAFDANKERFKIEDYSVSQTTLDQVSASYCKTTPCSFSLFTSLQTFIMVFYPLNNLCWLPLHVLYLLL